jgi:GT2 family glycosyltransferase
MKPEYLSSQFDGISICIVTLQARDYLRNCLNSIYENPPSNPFEIIVVDNYSQDGTLEMLDAEFQKVQVVANQTNLGYTTPMNQALQRAAGRFLLQLNPDTVVHPGAIDVLLDFFKNYPEAGICGPKVLNRDGTLQKQCRRGESRPWAVISYFSGLYARFPNRKFFGGYLLNYMDENETHPVAGVSGSCMMIRREVIEEIGYLDERFFAWQEDADYCFRAWKKGWQVYYVPRAIITHFGGEGGSRVEPYRSIIEWHRSYYRFYKKNYAEDYFLLFNWFYYSMIIWKLLFSLLVNFLKRDNKSLPNKK